MSGRYVCMWDVGRRGSAVDGLGVLALESVRAMGRVSRTMS